MHKLLIQSCYSQSGDNEHRAKLVFCLRELLSDYGGGTKTIHKLCLIHRLDNVFIQVTQTSHTNKVRIQFWVWEVLVINIKND